MFSVCDMLHDCSDRVSQVEIRVMRRDLMQWRLQRVGFQLPPQGVLASPPTLALHQVLEVNGPHYSVYSISLSEQSFFCFLLLLTFSDSYFILSVNPLSFLRNQPQFHVMRQLIQQNAALLPALLQEIGRENPELLQVKYWQNFVCFK